MANQKISELTTASTPLDGTELVEIVQGGTNRKATAQDIADLGGGGSGTVTNVTGTSPIVITGTSTVTPNVTLSTVPVSLGGTGVTSLTPYGIVFGGTSGTGAVQSGSLGSVGQVLTSNGAGSLPTFQSLSGDLSEYGLVFDEDFSGNLDNYTKSLGAGITMTIVGGQLEIAAGTTNLNTNRMYYNVWGPTNMESFTMEADVIVGTLSATSYGIGFDQYSIASAGVAVNNNFKIAMETGNVGKITVNCILGASPVLYTKTSDVGLAMTAGDVLHVKWRLANNRHFFEVTNVTTGETNSLEYVITLSYQSDMGPSGAYAIAVHGYGGTHYVDNWRFVCNEPVGADFAYLGDSKTKGNGADHLLNRWGNKIKDRCDVDVIVLASAGASLYDITMADIQALQPQKIVLDIGVNDLTGAGNAAALFVDYQALVADIVAEGYVVGTSLFLHLLTPYQPKAADIAAFNDLIVAAYPNAFIDLYTAMLSGSSYNTRYSIDGIHPSVEGQNFIANTHINYFDLPIRTNRTVAFSQVLYNELNSYVTIGDFWNKVRTPKNILDLQQNGSIDGTASIHLTASTGTSTAAREEGVYLSNIDTFGCTILSSNAKPNAATTFTAKATFGSAYKQFNGTHFFQTFSGAVVGNTVTPTQQGRWNPTGLIIGAGSTAAGMLDIQQGVLTSAWIPAFVANGGAHTGQTASTEFQDAQFNFNRTVQHATGTLALQRSVYFRAPTYSFVGASALTRMVTVAISGPPITSTNNTADTAIGLEVETTNVDPGAGSVASAYAAVFNAPSGATANYGIYVNGIASFGASNTAPTAIVDLGAGTTSNASLRIRSGVAPSSPNSGDAWYETTNTRLMFRQNATSIELIGTSSVNSVSPTAPDRTLTVLLNGTTYYIHAKTTND